MTRRLVFSRYDILVWVCLGVLAGSLRILPVGVNSFASDEARLSLLALQTAHGEQVARFGIASSAGTRNLPASVYAFVPPYFFTSDALIATWYVALLNVCGIFGVWVLLKRCLGRRAAFFATLWLAAQPFAVVFSRNIWTQNLLMPLAAAWLVTAFFATTTQKPRWRFGLIALNMALAGTAFQVHLAGLALFPAALYVFLRFRWWRFWPPVVMGGLLACVPLLPFLYHAACCAPELMNEYRAAAGDGAGGIDAQSFLLTLRIAAGYDWAYMANGDWNSGAKSVLWAVWAGGIALVAVVGGVAAFFAPQRNPPLNQHHPQSATKTLIELALVLLIASIITFAYHSAPVRLHYQLGALPAIAVLIAASIWLLHPLRHRAPHRRWFAAGYVVYAAGIVGIAASWSIQLAVAFAQIQDKVAPNGIGSLLKAPYQVAQAIPKDAPVMVHTVSDDVTNRGEPATWAVLLWEREHRVIDGWSVLIVPPEPAYFLSEEASIPAWEELEAAGLISQSQYFYPIEGMPSYYLTRYDGTSSLQGFTPLATPIAFTNGLTLVGWKVRQLPDRLRLSTRYHVDELPAAGAYRQFTHLRAAAAPPTEPPLLIADVPLSAHNWRVGDTLVVMADFFPPVPGEVWFDVGQYDAVTLGRFARADEQGDSVRLGGFIQP